MSMGRPSKSRGAEFIAAAIAVALGATSPGALTAIAQAPVAMPAPAVKNTGKEPGGAFLVDFRKGFDPETHDLADYVMNFDWIGVANDPELVEFDDGGMTLNIEKRQTRGVPYRASEFQRMGFYGYGRYEVVMRGAKGQGVVSAFFTHTFSQFGDPHDEIDFEFLGRDTRRVQLNYFGDGDSWGGKIIDLPFDYTDGFHLYAFEWEPRAIRWFIDDKMVHEVRSDATAIPLPTASQRVIANIWAGRGGAAQWTGSPTFQTASASFLCMSHVPAGQAGAQCSDRPNSPG